MSEIRTDSLVNQSGDNDSGIDLSTNDVVAIKTANSEALRVDSSGTVYFKTTPTWASSVRLQTLLLLQMVAANPPA
jgi:hypothetical protein